MPPFLLLLVSEFKVRFSARSATKVNARVGWIVTVLLHKRVRREVCNHIFTAVVSEFSQDPTDLSEHSSHSKYLFIRKVSRLYE